MASFDPNAPVLVGVGELTRGPKTDPSELTEPAEMMASVLRLAAEDAGPGARLLRRASVLAAAPTIAWGDGDPARRVGDLLGLGGVPSMRSSMQGGNGPQLLVNRLAERIQAGELDVALICGAEAVRSIAVAAKQGVDLGWPPPDPERSPGEILEGARAGGNDAEAAVAMIAPLMAYPLIENAIREASGRTVAEQQMRIASLWSRFSEVAAGNPYAWTPRRYSASELAEPSAENRRVSFPYTKLLNANIQVDQAAGLILCSATIAGELGIDRDRWVFVHAGAQATDVWNLSERPSLDRSLAIEACGRALYEHTDAGPDDLCRIDLYSCFPAAVELAADALGLPLDDPSRPLTETGGLTFFGGPGNNYATHGIAAVCRALREGEPGELGLATALGWYATKHALGIYGNAPPAKPFATHSPEVDQTIRPVAEPAEADARAETCTVIYDRDGSPSYGILFALLDDGRRALAQSTDPDTMEAMTTDGFLGSTVRLDAKRGFRPNP